MTQDNVLGVIYSSFNYVNTVSIFVLETNYNWSFSSLILEK